MKLFVDKKLFKKTFWYSLSFFALLFIFSEIFSRILQYAANKIPITVITTAEQVGEYASSTYGYLILILVTIILFIVLQLYNYSFFENLIWNTITKKKTTMKTTNKFLGLFLLMSLILGLLAGIVFLLISLLPDSLIKMGVAIFYLACFFAFYLLSISFASFANTHLIFKSIKDSYKIGIKRIDLTIFPLIMMLAIAIAVNLLLLLFQWLPDIALLVLESIVIAAYFAWARIYLSNSLKSVKF